MSTPAQRMLAVTLIVLGLTGCATTYQLRPEARTPAAAGTINATTDSNDNTTVTIHVRHLPEPSGLDSSLRTFVDWIRPNAQGEYRNVGQIVIDANREGRLDTTTPHRRFELIITAEASGAPKEPSQFVVLRGSRIQD